MTTTIAQVGVRGFGLIHLERIDRLAAHGRIELESTPGTGTTVRAVFPNA